jgi:hypothetical protein
LNWVNDVRELLEGYTKRLWVTWAGERLMPMLSKMIRKEKECLAQEEQERIDREREEAMKKVQEEEDRCQEESECEAGRARESRAVEQKSEERGSSQGGLRTLQGEDNHCGGAEGRA